VRVLQSMPAWSGAVAVGLGRLVSGDGVLMSRPMRASARLRPVDRPVAAGF